MSKRHCEDYYKSGSTKTHNETTEYSRQHDSKKQRTSDKYESDRGRSDKSSKSTESDQSKLERTNLRPLSDSKHELSKKTALSSGIQIKLGAPKTAKETKPKLTVASIFNQESDDEPEEMPPEAKMRMRNIGRDTPTSAGPNSFGKTKQGFCHAKKVFEKSLEKALDDLNDK